MVIGAYVNLGWGFLFLLVLVAIGFALLAWVFYWATRGFCAAPPRSLRGPQWWLVRLVPLLALLTCFPPMRRAGDWSDLDTGKLAAATTTFDRHVFGWIPSYRWVGQLGSEVEDDPGPVLTIDKHQTWYRQDHERWVIDWLYMSSELVIVAILPLPFALARQRGRE